MPEQDASPESGTEPWQESREQTKLPVMLALFDVLGFSKRLTEEGIEKVVARYNDLIATTLKRVEERREWQS